MTDRQTDGMKNVQRLVRLVLRISPFILLVACAILAKALMRNMKEISCVQLDHMMSLHVGSLDQATFKGIDQLCELFVLLLVLFLPYLLLVSLCHQRQGKVNTKP